MNKISNRLQRNLTLIVFFLLTTRPGLAQDTVRNAYGLWVISDWSTFRKTVDHDGRKAMADLSRAVPGIAFDLRYASVNNFMRQQLYPVLTTSWMRKPAAEALARVQAELDKSGYGLKIFDAYRPYAVTVKMWEPVKDDRYAADPRKGSGHNRGIAVDLTLIDKRSGKELPMGTGFDNFSDTAHHNFRSLSPAVLQNRLLLKTTMEKNGFKSLDSEWWHYFFVASKDDELLDIPFAELKKNIR